MTLPSGYDWYDGSKLDDQKAKTRQRHIRGRRMRVMRKLDQSKVEYIVAEKREGTKNQTMADWFSDKYGRRVNCQEIDA